MCKYQYQHQERFKKQSKTRSCFCSTINQIYQENTKYQSAVKDWYLPIDENGFCVLHSSNIAWKRQYDIPKIIQDLIILVDIHYKEKKDNKLLEYDFSECIITGRPLKELSIRGNSKYAIYFKNLECKLELNFSHSVFIDGFIFENSNVSSFNLKHTQFKEPVKISDTSFNYADFDYSLFEKDFRIMNTTFLTYTSFDFLKAKSNVGIFSSTFKSMTSFIDMTISSEDNSSDYLKEFEIKDVSFKNEVRFNNTVIKSSVSFENVEFTFETEFYNTSFAIGRSLHDFTRDTISFKNILINENTKLSFRGEKPFSMLFTADTAFSFNAIKGLVIFENIDLSTINKTSKALLFKLEKEKKIHLGKGCEKYRVRSEPLTIKASKSTQHLILELTRVFSNYFGLMNRFNLGVEILETKGDFIQYFFFTDDDVSQSEFDNIINQTQSNFWKLLVDVPNIQNQELNMSKEESETLLAKSYILVDLNSILTKLGVKFQIDNELPFNALKALEMGGKTQLNKSIIESISKRNYFQSLNIYLNNKTEVIGDNNIVVENIHDSNVEISSTNQE